MVRKGEHHNKMKAEGRVSNAIMKSISGVSVSYYRMASNV